VPDSVERVREYYRLRGESEWHRLAAPFDGGVEWEIHRRAFGEWLAPASHVLDLGGGPGRRTIWLAERGHRVVLGDLSPAQLDIAGRDVTAVGGPAHVFSTIVYASVVTSVCSISGRRSMVAHSLAGTSPPGGDGLPAGVLGWALERQRSLGRARQVYRILS